jgi:protein SCO1
MPRALASIALLALTLAPAACAPDRPARDFILRTDDGGTWQLSGQRGKAVLLTFGFTHCGDTCPATLAKLVRLSTTLGERSKVVEIAFVTVDPTRDSPLVLHRFLHRFEVAGASTLVGLTGTPAQISQTEAGYHVYAKKVRGDVAHSAVIFFIDPGGRLRGMRDDDDSQQALLKTVRELLG